jgi:hypothetical protein
MTKIKKATLNITKDWKKRFHHESDSKHTKPKIDKIREGGVLYVEGS